MQKLEGRSKLQVRSYYFTFGLWLMAFDFLSIATIVHFLSYMGKYKYRDILRVLRLSISTSILPVLVGFVPLQASYEHFLFQFAPSRNPGLHYQPSRSGQ